MCKYTKPPGIETQSYQLVKMVVCLQFCTKQKMQSVIQFLSAEGVKPVEVYTRMLAKYRTYVSQTQVYKWVQKFNNRVQIVEDSSQPGKAHRVIEPEITAGVEDLIQSLHYN
jgi:predicted aldo/keto reductase-like oxidoreductase